METNMTNIPSKTKPPLGIIPHKMWLEHRIAYLQEAIKRAIDEHYVTQDTIKWSRELTELLEVYNYKFKPV